MPPSIRSLLPILIGFILSLSWVCALVWPLPLHLKDWHTLSAFGDSHIWVFSQQSEALFGEPAGDEVLGQRRAAAALAKGGS